MSVYKCAIIGASGARANGHAEAYRLIERGRLVAASARQTDRLHAFADRHAVVARYADYREMVDKEQPDLVHVNTPPHARLEILAHLDAAGVPAVVVEKPLAVEGEDYRRWRDLAPRLRTKVAVNHQLHFHEATQHLRQAVAGGDIGEVQRCEATCRLNVAAQGTHMLQLIGGFSGHARPTTVSATATGGAGLGPHPGPHCAPDDCHAELAWGDAMTASLHAGPTAPIARADQPEPFHKQIHVQGSRGRAYWSMWGWSILDHRGRTHAGEHDYHAQDRAGQARLTDAMFDWLEDESCVHPLHLAAALDEFNTLLGIYTGVLRGQPVSLPVEPEDGLIARLRERLGA